MTLCLIATTPQRLRSHVGVFDWELAPLPGIRQADTAYVLLKKSDLGEAFDPQLWVDVSYTRYRPAFLRFLNEYFDLEAATIPRQWQVDHLRSRHRFGAGSPKYLVRLFLLDRGINAAFGAGFEKKFFTQERRKEPVGGFHLDWITFLKAYGTRLPSMRRGP